jgi:hypothetical protein
VFIITTILGFLKIRIISHKTPLPLPCQLS